MITIEELDVKVREEFKDCAVSLKDWDRMRKQLGSDDQEYGGWADTYIDEIADFCWLCGCNMSFVQDYWDGSPTYTVSLPRTEEEYQQNLKEANAWWKEVME